MTRLQTTPKKTKIGENDVEESKMDHVVPNQELSTKDFSLMSEAQVMQELHDIPPSSRKRTKVENAFGATKPKK